MTVDRKLSIIGGRNIGDKYLVKKPPDDFVYDWDLIIYNAKQTTGSVIVQMHLNVSINNRSSGKHLASLQKEHKNRSSYKVPTSYLQSQ